MARARARGDPGADGVDEPGDALACELVEVRRGGLLELGAVLRIGVAAEPVHHDEQDLRVGRLDEGREVHADHATFRAW